MSKVNKTQRSNKDKSRAISFEATLRFDFVYWIYELYLVLYSVGQNSCKTSIAAMISLVSSFSIIDEGN